jgi:hypothetical protein
VSNHNLSVEGKVSYMHYRELIGLKQALRSASVPERKVCCLSRLDHDHLVHRRDGVAHAGIYRRVHKPRHGLLVHRLQNERLRDGTQNRLLLRLEGDDGLGYPACVDNVPPLAVSCSDIGCDLQRGYAE